MAPTMIKCPKCNNMCEFAEGRLFSFCNKCGSKLERDIDNNIMVYERAQEKDEDLLLVNERYEVCSNMTVPTRANFDIESLNYEIERMMDEFMTFCEVLKDVYGMLDSMDDTKKHRVCELCLDVSDRIFMQFEQFLKEYNDFGMYDELKQVRDAFNAKVQKLSAEFAVVQKDAMEKFWADRKDEYEALTNALKDAKERRARVPFMDFETKWALDAEIERLQNELTKAR